MCNNNQASSLELVFFISRDGPPSYFGSLHCGAWRESTILNLLSPWHLFGFRSPHFLIQSRTANRFPVISECSVTRPQCLIFRHWNCWSLNRPYDRPTTWMIGKTLGKLAIFWTSFSDPRFKAYRRLLQTGLIMRASKTYRPIQKQESRD